MTREEAQHAILHDLVGCVAHADRRDYSVEAASAIVGDACSHLARNESPNPRRKGQPPTIGELVNVAAAIVILARETIITSGYVPSAPAEKTPN